MNTAIRPISRASVLTMLNHMSWHDRRWISKRLSEQVAHEEPVTANDRKGAESLSLDVVERDNARLDAALAKFSGEWGGERNPVELAQELRQGVEMVRDVDTW